MARRPPLRALPTSDDYFRGVAAAQRPPQKVVDRNFNGLERELPENEIITMALNEIAAAAGRGFFFYLPSREVWKTPEKEPILPGGRAPGAPRFDYPTMLFMDYIWDPMSQAAFSAQGHRGRWLKCNALINPPTSKTPIYAVQYIDHGRAPAYTTPTNSLAVIATNDCYYLVSTHEFEATAGKWDRRKSWKPSGPDPESRLDTVPYLFDHTKRATTETYAKYLAFQWQSQPDLESLYDGIIRRCKFPTGDISPTMTAEVLKALIPRGGAPLGGTALGTPVGNPSIPALSEPPSQRGVKRPRASKKAAQKTGRAKDKTTTNKDPESYHCYFLDDDTDDDEEPGFTLKEPRRFKDAVKKVKGLDGKEGDLEEDEDEDEKDGLMRGSIPTRRDLGGSNDDALGEPARRLKPEDVDD